MSTRNPTTPLLKRAALVAGVAALAVTMTQPSMAASAAKTSAALSLKAGSSDVTDFSAQRRRYSRGGGYGGAAAAAAVAGIVGTAIIASQSRGYYGSPYDSYAYSGGPGYYGGGPAYYGGGGYYGGPGYYGRSTGYRNGNGGVPLYRGHPLASW